MHLKNEAYVIKWLTHVTEQECNLNAENVIDRLANLEKIHEELVSSS